MRAALKQELVRAFGTADLAGLEEHDEPWNAQVVYVLGGRRVAVTRTVMRRLDPPPVDSIWTGLACLTTALWDQEKRFARADSREPSVEAMFDRWLWHPPMVHPAPPPTTPGERT
jgi:hypothetical protein